ncbi:MAG: hypothetical protein R3B74_03245 [Nitrospirales bacterium]|nr:hypothetical protein [Nitrospirales bacterium]
MHLYFAFGVNLGNIGHGNLSRPSTKTLLMDWNQRLSISRGTRLKFIGAYGHTGNYILQTATPEQLENILAVLVQQVSTFKFVMFDFTKFLVALDSILRAKTQLPTAIPGRRWTPGIVMDMNPQGRIPPIPASDEKASFGSFALPRIRTAWKGDILDSQEYKLDNTQREGGWGSLSDRMKKVAGGTWTARSMKSVEGIVGVARFIR